SPGGGGSATAPGAGGLNSDGAPSGQPGAPGQGGAGGDGVLRVYDGAGGGGGGGWFGGGGGGATASGAAGGGGGGSGYGPPGTVFESGVREGDGLLTITFGDPCPDETTPTTSTTTTTLTTEAPSTAAPGGTRGRGAARPVVAPPTYAG